MMRPASGSLRDRIKPEKLLSGGFLDDGTEILTIETPAEIAARKIRLSHPFISAAIRVAHQDNKPEVLVWAKTHTDSCPECQELLKQLFPSNT